MRPDIERKVSGSQRLRLIKIRRRGSFAEREVTVSHLALDEGSSLRRQFAWIPVTNCSTGTNSIHRNTSPYGG